MIVPAIKTQTVVVSADNAEKSSLSALSINDKYNRVVTVKAVMLTCSKHKPLLVASSSSVVEVLEPANIAITKQLNKKQEFYQWLIIRNSFYFTYKCVEETGKLTKAHDSRLRSI